MKVGDKVRAQFITVPEEFPGKARGEKLYPIRKEIKESFRPEEVLA